MFRGRTGSGKGVQQTERNHFRGTFVVRPTTRGVTQWTRCARMSASPIRSFARRPAFALSAILSLAIGIAASSAVFSLMNAALFKPVPGVTRPERLVQIARDIGGDDGDVTWEVLRSGCKQESSVLEDLGALALVSASIAASNEPVARAGLAVTRQLLRPPWRARRAGPHVFA